MLLLRKLGRPRSPHSSAHPGGRLHMAPPVAMRWLPWGRDCLAEGGCRHHAAGQRPGQSI